MAPSRASWLATALLVCVASSAAEPLFDPTAAVHVAARSSDIDYKNNTGAFHAIRITQGPYAIEADEATADGLDTKGSQWEFHGNVKITMPDGSIASDTARVKFVANSIVDAQITGAPAVFEQRRDKRVARGHATHIDYDFGAATVRLSDGATLTDGEHEISGRTLVYDMKAQKLRANPDDQGGDPITLTIQPNKPDTKPKP